MKIFRKTSEQLDRIEAELESIKSSLMSIEVSLDILIPINNWKVFDSKTIENLFSERAITQPLSELCKTLEMRKHIEYPKDFVEIGSLLQHSGITLMEWKEEAVRNGWRWDTDIIKYESLIAWDDAIAIIEKAKLRKRMDYHPASNA